MVEVRPEPAGDIIVIKKHVLIDFPLIADDTLSLGGLISYPDVLRQANARRRDGES
jgi:hypothetical protein